MLSSNGDFNRTMAIKIALLFPPNLIYLGAMKIIIFALVVLLSSAIALAENSEGRLIIFYAGSLSIPFERIIEGFRNENPGVVVLKEIAGSRECARKISELHKPCDVLASADYQVIDSLLIPQYADWNLKFATNEMAVVYKARSRRAVEITDKNWLDILLDHAVNVGRADPDADPCGYRAIMTMKLAELYYRKSGLADTLLAKSSRFVRPKESELLALLNTGALDYVFLYRSVAEQRGLKRLILPDAINLKRADLEELYGKVSVELSGATPGSKVVQRGSSMVYGVTIPKTAPNPELAKIFVEYLLSMDKGLKVLEQMGQPAVIPSICDTYDKLPSKLRKFALKQK
jgi:molybdate/tungstate transport system substrate-binding protein